MVSETSGQLRRVLGVGFGLAVSVGGTIGVGILRTPGLVAEQLHEALAKVQNSPDTQKKLETEGASVVQMSSAEFGTFIARELDKWGKVVREAKIKPE